LVDGLVLGSIWVEQEARRMQQFIEVDCQGVGLRESDVGGFKV